jgi:AcrR family transcriptional regulator
MPPKRANQLNEANTEERIKIAARVVFHKKGFAATRTRDIAEEAGINLALLNYYFRSKEKLFLLIMVETLTEFYQKMGSVFNDEATTLEKKIELIAEKYIDLCIEESQMPIFIMSEMRARGTEILEKLPSVNTILQSSFIGQYKEAVREGRITPLNPLHFLMNLTSLIVFPFINSPAIKKIGKLTDRQFEKLMQERRKMIPIWMNAMFKAR